MEYSVSTLKTNTIQAATGSNVTIASGNVLQAPGHVLQVKQATDSTQYTVTSTSFVHGSNTLSVSITPSSTNSKILASYSTTAYNETNSSDIHLTIYRDSTNIGHSSYGLSRIFSNSSNIGVQMTGQVLDSPNTTSALTYRVYARVASGTAYYNGNTLGTITVMEIAQ